ncbi:MAG: 1-deoxy-D-xylulose-5-phosphate synthase [Chloroflexi bacterium]|nr:1-deoxy-D-xylulose-5-phosphate synthase [Chloroflexota bacterium]
MFLDTITGPQDLTRLTTEQLTVLADEVRARLIECIPKTGGHFSPNLGTVELTVALLATFDSPHDRIVWDVGHQAYAHKVLTGRNDRMETLRQYGGLCGFLAREESEHDAFGAGHTSTSISAALGMAAGMHLRGDPYHAVAVIGDGALTGGMAYEALNNAGHLKLPLIVVLNDNEMSISPSVGALNEYLTRLRSGEFYQGAKERVEQMLRHLPQGDHLVELGKRAKHGIREFASPVTLIWEELGFTYLGPIDGHDIGLMVDIFKRAKTIDPPLFLHVLTKKGKGFKPAEDDSLKLYNLPPPGVPGAPLPKKSPAYQDIFGACLARLADTDRRIVGITAAMSSGTGLATFQAQHPSRFYDVGIAEQHAVTFAAGLAVEGFRPVAAIYSTFLQRAYDQIIHDVAIQKLPVIFAIDRAGLVGEDGRTHHGALDIAYLRLIPNMTLMAPKDEAELCDMLATALTLDGPSALRYPRGAGPGVEPPAAPAILPIGVAEVLRSGDDVAIVAVGAMVAVAQQAAEDLARAGVAATVVNARFIKPLDEALLLDLGRRIGRVITVEEGVLAGGFGSAIGELYHRAGLSDVRLRALGLSDAFVEHGALAELRTQVGLTPGDITAAAGELAHSHGGAALAGTAGRG